MSIAKYINSKIDTKVLTIVGIFLFFLSAHFLSNPTQEQKKLFVKYDIDDPKEWVSRTCAGKEICKQYKQIRIDCSIAGDFNNCIEVRSKEIKTFLYPYLCAEDGTVLTLNSQNEKVPLYTYLVLPTDTQCRFNKFRLSK